MNVTILLLLVQITSLHCCTQWNSCTESVVLITMMCKSYVSCEHRLQFCSGRGTSKGHQHARTLKHWIVGFHGESSIYYLVIGRVKWNLFNPIQCTFFTRQWNNKIRTRDKDESLNSAGSWGERLRCFDGTLWSFVHKNVCLIKIQEDKLSSDTPQQVD